MTRRDWLAVVAFAFIGGGIGCLFGLVIDVISDKSPAPASVPRVGVLHFDREYVAGTSPVVFVDTLSGEWCVSDEALTYPENVTYGGPVVFERTVIFDSNVTFRGDVVFANPGAEVTYARPAVCVFD